MRRAKLFVNPDLPAKYDASISDGTVSKSPVVVTKGATTLSRSHSFLTAPTDKMMVINARKTEDNIPPITEITIKSASVMAELKPKAEAVPLAKIARTALEIRLREPEASKFWSSTLSTL